MPVITARVNTLWIRDEHMTEPWTERQDLMSGLLGELRGFVFGVIGRVDDKSMGLSDAVLEVQTIHPWSENVPDLWVTIRVNEIEAAEEERQKRRWAIARDVSGEIFHYLDQDKFLASVKPSISIECIPQQSSGIRRRADGTLDSKWGVPDYSGS